MHLYNSSIVYTKLRRHLVILPLLSIAFVVTFVHLAFLTQVLIYNSSIDNQESMSLPCDEEAAVFFLELLIRVVLQNR